MNIAIIGTGISGLTSAYVLSKKHNVTVFEKNDYVGGHTHTHEIEYQNKIWFVDSGFIVYNERTYPNFIKLLDQLGVECQVTRMGFSVKSERYDLEYAGHSLNGLFAQRRNIIRPSFLKMLRNMARFNSESVRDLDTIDSSTTLGEYLTMNNYSKEFIQYYIIPIGAAIWSTIPEKMMEFPAAFFIRFFDNHGLLQVTNRPKWWVIKGGSKTYVDAMISGFKDNILLSSPVKKVKRAKNKINISYGKNSENNSSFDSVIFATHSDESLALLEDATVEEKDILGKIKYQKNDAILHYDTSILPSRRNAWSSWNYQLDKNRSDAVALTYNMNILQTLNCNRTFCVTLNSRSLVDEDKIIKELKYTHPLFTNKALDAQKRKEEINGKNNTYYCGAYWYNGFHEDGVVSALDVCSMFGESL